MRHIYLLFVAAFAVTLFGFWPSFYSGPGHLDPWRVAHGSLATLWMLMLIGQSWLIGHGHNRLHRLVGRTSLLVVPALIFTASYVVHLMLAAGLEGFPRDLRLTLAFIDIWSLALFAALYVLALAYRRRMDLHARFMGSTIFVALPPALGRALGMNLPSLGGLPGALDPSMWIVEALLAALILHDASKRRVFAPYPLTLAAMTAIHLGMWRAPHWPWFAGLAHVLGLP